MNIGKSLSKELANRIYHNGPVSILSTLFDLISKLISYEVDNLVTNTVSNQIWVSTVEIKESIIYGIETKYDYGFR